MTDTLEIVILEDNPERRQAMAARLADRFPQYPVRFFHVPSEMVSHLQETLSRTLLISLDHDLDLIPQQDGTLFDPGSAMEVVDWLVSQPPACPVVIHTTNVPAAKLMKQRLKSAGWPVRRIAPYDDLAWIDEDWFTCVRDLLLHQVQPTSPAARTSVAKSLY